MMKSDGDIQSWLKRARSQDRAIRMDAIENLPGEPNEVVEAELRNALHDPEALVRLAAAEQLGRCPTEKSREALLALIDAEPDLLVRAHALSSLGLVSKPEDVARLQSSLQEAESVEVAVHSAVGMFEAARRTALASLMKNLSAPKPEVRSLASEALLSIVQPREDLFVSELLKRQASLETDADALSAQEAALFWVAEEAGESGDIE